MASSGGSSSNAAELTKKFVAAAERRLTNSSKTDNSSISDKSLSLRVVSSSRDVPMRYFGDTKSTLGNRRRPRKYEKRSENLEASSKSCHSLSFAKTDEGLPYSYEGIQF